MKKYFIWPFLLIASLSRKFRYHLLTNLVKIRDILSEETKESKEMLEIYYLFSVGKASADDLKIANAQFRDIIKTAGLGAFLILPFAPLTIPFIVKLGRALGIDVLPSSVRKKYKNL